MISGDRPGILPGPAATSKQEIAKGAMPGPAYRAAVVADIVKLPVRTIAARRIDGQRWEIYIENPRKGISAFEKERIKKDGLTLMKKFGKANDAPDRKNADQHGFDVLWADWKRREKDWNYRQTRVPEVFRQDLDERPYFQTWWREAEDGRRIEHLYIEDLRWALRRYCDRWDVPASRKISQPGRRKGLELNGAKIRELRNRLGLTQRALGEACNPVVDARTIMRAEQGISMSEGLPENLAATISRLGHARGISITARDLLRK